MPRTSAFVRTIQEGNRAESLKALRNKLAARFEEAETKDSAAVARQLMAVIKELDSLGIGREESPADEARNRRADRRARAEQVALSDVHGD